MAQIEVSAVLHRPPETVHDVLIDFSRYPRYSEYLRSVSTDGDGGVGTTYTLRFAWWKISYTVRSRVTHIERPERIAFEVVEGIDAAGAWHIEPVPDAGPTEEAGSRLRFAVEYDPSSIGGDVDLPPLVSLDWVIEKAEPRIREEAERVMRRVAADVEGESRSIDVHVDA